MVSRVGSAAAGRTASDRAPLESRFLVLLSSRVSRKRGTRGPPGSGTGQGWSRSPRVAAGCLTCGQRHV